jgi:redox-regulated HSP33 family molecular chaperone
MAFKRLNGVQNTVMRERVVSSITAAVGSLLMASRTAGTLVAATSSVTVSLMQGGGLVVEAVTSSETKAQVQPIEFNTEYIADTTNNSNVAHNYMRMTLTDASTVNNTGTDDSTNGIFMQTGVIGATGDKKIKGEFIPALT